MNLVRLIILALAVWLAINFLRRLTQPSSPHRPIASPKNMVRCADCGLYLPQAEAVTDQGRYFCCEQHRRDATRS